MDFVFLYELLAGFIEERVKCVMFSTFITSTFINMHQAPTAAMMMRKYGITSWNPEFKESLVRWKKAFEGKDATKIKMQWIKRVISRTLELYETDGVNIDMLIEGN